MAEQTPAVGPIDARRFGRIDRHGLQAGEADQKHKRHPLPHIDADHREHGGERLRQPQHVVVDQTHPLQQNIQHAVRGRIDEPGDHPRRDRRCHHWNEKEQVDERARPPAADGAMHEQRQRQAEEDLHHQRPGHVDCRRPQRGEELGVVQGPREVVQPDELPGAVTPQAEADVVQEWIDDQRRQQHHGRRHQQVGCPMPHDAGRKRPGSQQPPGPNLSDSSRPPSCAVQSHARLW